MMQMNPKKARKAILKNSRNSAEIVEMYYKQAVFQNVIKRRTFETTYYVHNVKEIIDKFHMNSVWELIVILHHAVGEKLGECEFCGENKSRVKTRTSEWNVIDCKHTGICKSCDRPYQHANKMGVCYRCAHTDDDERPEYYDSPSSKISRFMTYAGNYIYIEYIDNADEADAMMEIAAMYYHRFKSIRDKLASQTKNDEG